MNIYPRLFDELKPHWKLLCGSVGFPIVMAAMKMVPAALTRPLIDDAIYGKNWPLLKLLGVALLLALVFRTIAHFARMVFTGRLAHRVLYQVRTKLYEHLQSLSLSFYQNKRTGQIMSRVTNDVAVLEQFIVEGIRESLVNVLRVVIIASILFHTNPQLALGVSCRKRRVDRFPRPEGTRLVGRVREGQDPSVSLSIQKQKGRGQSRVLFV